MTHKYRNVFDLSNTYQPKRTFWLQSYVASIKSRINIFATFHWHTRTSNIMTNATTAMSSAFNSDDFARRVNEWVNSPNGLAQIRSAQTAIQLAAERTESASIEQELLRAPITL